ncbi:MAG: DUF2178 domain-containing protein [Patescibacteria group bacterium]|jgi:uncharacterized membrane protein|nr:DUF2178 domain-containing protein [Patescibacteria group bacterium]
MTPKQYQIVKLIFVFILAVIFSQGIVFSNYLIPIASLVLSSLILLYLRRKVSGIMADERDYSAAGKSALWAIQIYSWLAVVSMLLLYAARDFNPAYEPIAMTLAFSTCILMLLYALIFRYQCRIKFTDKKLIYTILVLIFFVIMAIAALRLFSGEDNWLCVNGQWVKHGQPDFPAPSIECK